MWFAWKFVPLWYQQQLPTITISSDMGCDLLENSYLCGISNNAKGCSCFILSVVICLKIRTFVVSATTLQKQMAALNSCDLLENSYLCGISNNLTQRNIVSIFVVICLKIRTFVVSATTNFPCRCVLISCDLLENSYLCGISNNLPALTRLINALWFAWKFVPLWYQQQHPLMYYHSENCCDLLENSYLCGISNNNITRYRGKSLVVICLKIRTFVVSATTQGARPYIQGRLWFAWKFVPLWYQQQLVTLIILMLARCDLLENSYLCGISNNVLCLNDNHYTVVICLKIRTFVVSATTVRSKYISLR